MPINVKGASTPSMKVTDIALTDLETYEKNPRKNDKAVPAMVDLIKRFGFRQPILVQGNRVVDGHLRIKAANKLKMKMVPAIDVGKMSEAEIKALRISMNKAAEFADWDFGMLANEFDELRDLGFDMEFTGFDEAAIDKIIADQKAEKPTKTKDADAGNPADPNYVSVSFHMSSANRTSVIAVLNQIRMTKQVTNVSQALVALCRDVAKENDMEWKGDA